MKTILALASSLPRKEFGHTCIVIAIVYSFFTLSLLGKGDLVYMGSGMGIFGRGGYGLDTYIYT